MKVLSVCILCFQVHMYVDSREKVTARYQVSSDDIDQTKFLYRVCLHNLMWPFAVLPIQTKILTFLANNLEHATAILFCINFMYAKVVFGH